MNPTRALLAVFIGTVVCSIHPISGTDEFCTGKPNGNYKDPKNCHGFIQCSNGYMYKLQCYPDSLVYNEVTDRCDYEQNTPCDEEFSCERKPNGNYKDLDNCHGFIQCRNGTMFKRLCNPKSLVYDEDTHQCVNLGATSCN